MNLLKFLFLLLFFTFMSCQSEVNTLEKLDNEEISKSLSRGVSTKTIELNMNEGEDDDAVSAIHRNLLSAENEATKLDVDFTASNEAEDGFFVFKVESSDQKDLTLELYDEEGFELAGTNQIYLLKGNNYRALNVGVLDDGTYIMKLKDETGAELKHKFTVK